MKQKMKFLQNRKNRYLCYLLIMAMQVLVMLYWGTQKQNYHIDELYSMGYANSFVGTGDTATYIVPVLNGNLKNGWKIRSIRSIYSYQKMRELLICRWWKPLKKFCLEEVILAF